VLVGSRVTAHVPPLNASAWIITFAGMTIVVAGITGVLGDGFTTDVEVSGWLAMLGLAIFSTVISISAFLAGLARLDAFRASIISTIEPVFTVVLAALLLDERLSGQQAGGGLVIVVSSAALQIVAHRESRRIASP
jgi:drug/metabolite transporter (DMT)-like permease